MERKLHRIYEKISIIIPYCIYKSPYTHAWAVDVTFITVLTCHAKEIYSSEDLRK